MKFNELIANLFYAAFFLLSAVYAGAAQTTFSNTTPIIFGDNSSSAPYPSTINVAGLASSISKVTVQLNGFSHTFPGDIDIMLVSPSGERLVLFSDVCGSGDITNITFTLDDAAPFGPSSTQCTSGTFRPRNIDTTTDAFPAPAPAPTVEDSAAPAGMATLAKFNGINPNGTWSLYVRDDSEMDTGSLSGGWSLTITTMSTTAASVNVSGRVLSANGRGIRNIFVRLVDESGQSRTVITSVFGYYRFVDVPAGQTYTIGVWGKKYSFTQPAQVLNLTGDTDDINFVADN